MNYETFILSVEQLAQLPHEQAEQFTCTTLNTLLQRVSQGQAEDIAARLPVQLRRCALHQGPQATYDLDGYLNRLENLLGVDRSTAERVTRAVLATLWTAVGPKEFADMQAQLPGEFVSLIEAAVAQAPPRPREDEPPFRGPVSLDGFISRVAERAGLDTERAKRAAESVLEVLAMRVTDGQLEDMRPFLPYELRPALDRGLTRSRGRALPLSLDAFVEEITKREGVSRAEAEQHARAVLSVLHDVVGDKEFSDTISQLPVEYRTLVAQA
ncbi:DUF2267 domain-containing protein [Planosporangium flavigriseum]|uniref:DUF2267 domain-containing protein n=1 Tax=Planosporangium flavigriseum TaxID=373681 RepID=A0A8J3PM34_9ACTN|nr:DUF2267 domain-containing protein [Planosporangium flavigriseum]NJC66187.1 DUF2267 domain-containing protein [Planosporangium flavigriseum]GIG75121.1 hypothetical protein Pfl04_35250 [Planosporangium flavigriseum]